MSARRLRKDGQINIRVPIEVKKTWDSLPEGKKKLLTRMFLMNVLASTDDEELAQLAGNLSITLKYDEKSLEKLKEVLKQASGSEEVRDLARSAVAFIKFLINVENSVPGSCELLRSNLVKAQSIIERARELQLL